VIVEALASPPQPEPASLRSTCRFRPLKVQAAIGVFQGSERGGSRSAATRCQRQPKLISCRPRPVQFSDAVDTRNRMSYLAAISAIKLAATEQRPGRPFRREVTFDRAGSYHPTIADPTLQQAAWGFPQAVPAPVGCASP